MGNVTKPIFNVDADPWHADWLRSMRWDIWTRDHKKIVRTLDELRAVFDEDDDRLAHFMGLPAAKPMPTDLRSEVERYLSRGVITKIAVYRNDDIERLADLEHRQWWSWSKSLSERGDVPPDLAERWKPLWVPYEELPEDEKEKDREWARRALAVVRKSDEPTGAAWAAKQRLEQEFKAAAAWEEEKHPRVPSGRGGGGQFTSGAAPEAAAPHAPAAPDAMARREGPGEMTEQQDALIRQYEQQAWQPGGAFQLPHIAPPHDQVAVETPNTPEFNAIVDSVTNRAVTEEPAITRTMLDIIGQTGGMHVGLDYRLKARGSVARKIHIESRIAGMTPQQWAPNISDPVRYTVVYQPDNYAAASEQAAATLRAAGYTPWKKTRNYWSQPEYKGINTWWQTPAGQQFEVQFHTPQSVLAKEVRSHPIYEEQRALPTHETGRRSALAMALRSVWQAVQVPAGVLGLTL